MKLISIIILSILMSVSITAQNFTELTTPVRTHSQTKLLKNAQWCLYAKYLDTGEEIIKLNENMSVAPASGLKVFTTSAALDILGEDFRFETKLYYEGTIIKNILHGDIIIVGGGDPTLGSDRVEGSLNLDELMSVWVNAIREMGILEIKGSIKVDDLLYDNKQIPNHWEWIDLGNYYAATSSALSINSNLYYLFFKPGKNPGDPAEVLRTEPDIPGMSFNNFMLTGGRGTGDNGYIFGAPNQYNVALRGTIPAGVDEFSIKGSIPDPSLFAAQYLTGALKKKGINVSGEPKKLVNKKNYNNVKYIFSILSPPLKDIVYVINKKSDNVYTELLLKAISYRKSKIGSTTDGVKHVEEFLSGYRINTNGLILYDGSGLSRSNSITSKMMVELLESNTKRDYFKSFFNSLAIVGDKNDIGAFKNTGIGTAIEKNARIKSGLITGARSYSGYLSDKNDRPIVFSFIANNFDGPGSQVSRIHKELMIKLAELN